MSYTCPICKKPGKPDTSPCDDCHKARRVPLAHHVEDISIDRTAGLKLAREELLAAKLSTKLQPEEPIFCGCGELVPRGGKFCPNCDEPFEFEAVISVEEARDKLQLAMAEALITLLAEK